MKITIDLKIFLFALIFIFTKQIEFYVVLMTYAIVHEFGHYIQVNKESVKEKVKNFIDRL